MRELEERVCVCWAECVYVLMCPYECVCVCVVYMCAEIVRRVCFDVDVCRQCAKEKRERNERSTDRR